MLISPSMPPTPAATINHKPLAPTLRNHRTQIVLLAFLVLLGTALRCTNLNNVLRRSPDEYTYTNTANLLLDRGTPAAYATLFANYDPDRPSPARIGYHWLLTTTMHLTGDHTPRAGADLSCAASILSLLLLACMAWRILPSTGALAATLLYAVSPAELMLARRCWGESLVELLTLACLAVAAAVTLKTTNQVHILVGQDSASNGHNSALKGRGFSPAIKSIKERGFSPGGSRYLLFTALGVMALTVKETAAAGFLLALTWILLVLLLRGQRRSAAAFAGSAIAAAALSLLWAADRFGGFAQLHRLSILTSKASASSAYGLAYETGPGWLLLPGLWSLSAATLVLATLGAATTIYQARSLKSDERWQVLLGLLCVCMVLLSLAAIFPQRLNFRYICGIFSPLALLAGAGFSALLRALRRILPPTEASTLTVLATACLLLAAALDYRTFANNFADTDLQDLSIRMVLEASGRTMPALESSPP
jgi:hypothetical protein